MAVAAVAASAAQGSQLVARDATGVRLSVDAQGHALVTYTAQASPKTFVAWGAANARQPHAGTPQVEFQFDRSRARAQSFHGSCGKYDGPKLEFVVAACKAPDGSYWALQDWHVRLPDLGFLPWTSAFSARDLNLSHWTGREQAKLEVHNAWISGRWHQIFGRATYKTQPVYGFKTTRFGAGLDGYVRTLYLDTHNSMYGRGWRRENAFVSHRPSGMFCYTFYPHDPTRGGYRHPPGFTSERGPGTGDRYRLSMRGPGVTPDVSVTWGGLHAFDHGSETDVGLQQDAMRTLGGMLKQTPDALCKAGHLGELPG